MTDTTTAKAADLEQRMDSIAKKFASDGKITIMFIGVIVVGICYFWFGISSLSAQASPENLVDMLAGPIDEGMTDLRKQLATELVNAAPGFAEQLSLQAIESMPGAREALEKHIVGQLETEIGVVIATGETEFVAVLRDNRAEFEKALTELADNQDMSDVTIQIFVDAISQEMGTDMRDQAEQVIGTLIALREKAEGLKAGSELTFVSDMERRILMTARRLQLMEANPDFVAREKKHAETKKAMAVAEAAAAAAEAAAAETADGNATGDDAKKDDADAKKEGDAKPDDAKKDEAKKDDPKTDDAKSTEKKDE